MTRVPVKNGRKCVFQVVRVSGTIRKAEEEAIRRARDMISKARRAMEGQSDWTLQSIFGKDESHAGKETTNDILMVDRSDSEDDEELSDGGG
jgi:ribonuclease P/MRP protein subunit POP5